MNLKSLQEKIKLLNEKNKASIQALFTNRKRDFDKNRKTQ